MMTEQTTALEQKDGRERETTPHAPSPQAPALPRALPKMSENVRPGRGAASGGRRNSTSAHVMRDRDGSWSQRGSDIARGARARAPIFAMVARTVTRVLMKDHPEYL